MIIILLIMLDGGFIKGISKFAKVHRASGDTSFMFLDHATSSFFLFFFFWKLALSSPPIIIFSTWRKCQVSKNSSNHVFVTLKLGLSVYSLYYIQWIHIYLWNHIKKDNKLCAKYNQLFFLPSFKMSFKMWDFLTLKMSIIN